MKKFQPTLAKAIKRAGSEAELEKLLTKPATARQLKAVKDDRYLSTMSQRVFSAGLKHSMVEAKWPAFEEAFHAFEPRRVANMSEDELEALMQDRRLIRHWPKISSVPANANAMLSIAEEAGSFGAWIANWPTSDIVGLWTELTKRFKQLGGMSGPYFLRWVGKDTFMITPDVAKSLIAAGVVEKKPTGKRDLALVQEAFNGWADETGRPLCQLSRILALSMG